eukprot:5241162-Alexandrium_andersonii.AAC.1
MTKAANQELIDRRMMYGGIRWEEGRAESAPTGRFIPDGLPRPGPRAPVLGVPRAAARSPIRDA